MGQGPKSWAVDPGLESGESCPDPLLSATVPERIPLVTLRWGDRPGPLSRALSSLPIPFLIVILLPISRERMCGLGMSVHAQQETDGI